MVSIGNNAIGRCSNLQYLHLPSKFPEFGTNVFYEPNNICYLKAPGFSKDEEYKIKEMLTSRPFEETCLTPLEPLPPISPENYGILTVEQINAGIVDPPSAAPTQTPKPVVPPTKSPKPDVLPMQSAKPIKPPTQSPAPEKPTTSPEELPTLNPEQPTASPADQGSKEIEDNANGNKKKTGLIVGIIVAAPVIVGVAVIAGVFLLKKPRQYEESDYFLNQGWLQTSLCHQL